MSSYAKLQILQYNHYTICHSLSFWFLVFPGVGYSMSFIHAIFCHSFQSSKVFGFDVIEDIDVFKSSANVIIALKVSEDLKDVKDKFE